MEASAMQMITSSSLSSFSHDRSKTFAFVQTSWFRTDLISRVYVFVFRIFPHTGNRTKWRQFSCTCAKATGTESLHPTLQRVGNEGGREGKFYEVTAYALEICDGVRDVRTLWVLENFINGKFVTRRAKTTLTATCQANNDMYNTLTAGARKGKEMYL